MIIREPIVADGEGDKAAAEVGEGEDRNFKESSTFRVHMNKAMLADADPEHNVYMYELVDCILHKNPDWHRLQ